MSTIVYKDGGNCQRHGGTYSWKGVETDEQLSAALADGWFESLAEAIAPKVEESTKSREELEAIAAELGVKFDKRTSDKALAAKVEAALK